MHGITINPDMSLTIDDVDSAARARERRTVLSTFNKVASAIHLRFEYENCDALPERVKATLARLDDRRVTGNGIVIKAQEFRTQARNRQPAIERLQRTDPKCCFLRQNQESRPDSQYVRATSAWIRYASKAR